MARAVIAKGTPINAKDERGNTAIQCAIAGGHAPIVTMLLEQPDIDLNTKNADGQSTLWLALSLPDHSFASILVKRGCDVNLPSASGDSLLHQAIKSGDGRAALFLVENNALVDLKNLDKQTALHMAAAAGQAAVVQALLGHGAQVNVQDEQQQTPLIKAIRSQHAAVAKLLLASPAVAVEHADSSNNSALSLAVETGQLDVAELLLGKGANVEGNYVRGSTLLHEAIARGDEGGVQFLLMGRASPTKVTGEFVSPLHLAIQHGGNVRIVEQLGKFGAEVDAVDQNGATPLWAALRLKQFAVASVLVKLACDMNPVMDGLGPIHAAIREGDEEAAAFLISNGSNVNDSTNAEAVAPLHLAADKGLAQTASALLRSGSRRSRRHARLTRSGADVNARDSEGQTPLHRFQTASRLQCV